MPIDPETTVRRVREHVGDAVRWIVRYRGDDLDPDRDRVFVRDDVAPLLDEYDLEESVRALVMAEPMAETQEEKLDMANHRLTLRSYDDAVLLHVPYHEEEGLVVSADAAATDRFPELLDVLEAIDEEGADGR